MANILLLYDLTEKDLARDLQDFLEELNMGTIVMIPLSPNWGFSLQDKEKQYFDSADAALFLITPGAERLGSLFPLPSVTHEMGQAKQKFQKNPANVLYLVDKNCKLPVVDNKTYISFDRNDIRSVIGTLTQLLRDSKAAGIFRTTPIPTQTIDKQTKKLDIVGFSQNLSEQIKQILFDISNKPNGIIENFELDKLLTEKYHLSVQQRNFFKRDLESSSTILHNISSNPPYMNFWFLNDSGWGVVKLEVEKKKKLEQESLTFLMDALMKRKHLGEK